MKKLIVFWINGEMAEFTYTCWEIEDGIIDIVDDQRKSQYVPLYQVKYFYTSGE